MSDVVGFGDLSLRVCGRELEVPRSLALLRRVEGNFGAVYPLCTRLTAGGVTFDELVRLYGQLLHQVPGAPSRDAIESWVFREGGTLAAQKALAMPLFTLVMSDAEVREIWRRQEGLPRDDGEEEGSGPFSRAAASTGLAS